MNLFITSLSIPISSQSIITNISRTKPPTLLPPQCGPRHSRASPPSLQTPALCAISSLNHTSSTALIPILREFPRASRVNLKLPRKIKPQGPEWCNYCPILTLFLLIFSHLPSYLKSFNEDNNECVTELWCAQMLLPVLPNALSSHLLCPANSCLFSDSADV